MSSTVMYACVPSSKLRKIRRSLLLGTALGALTLIAAPREARAQFNGTGSSTGASGLGTDTISSRS
jgi:hypothetical protein